MAPPWRFLNFHLKPKILAIFDFPKSANFSHLKLIFSGLRRNFENRHGGATYIHLMYSQPKNQLNSSSGLGCRGVLRFLASANLIIRLFLYNVALQVKYTAQSSLVGEQANSTNRQTNQPFVEVILGPECMLSLTFNIVKEILDPMEPCKTFQLQQFFYRIFAKGKA